MQPNHRAPHVTSLPLEEVRSPGANDRSAMISDTRQRAPRPVRRRAPAPSPLYVFVVVSLAVFLVGLTFFCQPDVRHYVAGDLRLFGSSPVTYPTAPVSMSAQAQTDRAAGSSAGPRDATGRQTESQKMALQQLRQLVGDPRVWQEVLDEFQLTQDQLSSEQLSSPRFKFADMSGAEGTSEPRLTVSLEGTRPELSVRLINRYLQVLVERFEKSATGQVQPATLLAAEEQVKAARADRDRYQDELEKLLARLALTSAEPAEPAQDALEAGPALALTAPGQLDEPSPSEDPQSPRTSSAEPTSSDASGSDAQDRDASDGEGAAGDTSDSDASNGDVAGGEAAGSESAAGDSAENTAAADGTELAESAAADNGAETKDQPADQQAEIDAAAERRHLEAQLAEAERSLDAAVDLQRELRTRNRSSADLHLAVARAGRPVGRMAEPIPPRQLLWVLLPAVLVGSVVAGAARRGRRPTTLVSVDQVEAISPYPVIIMRPDGPGTPEPHLAVQRPGRLVRPLVHAGEVAVTLVAMLLVGYGVSADGFLTRLLADPLAAYAEAAAMTVHQLL